MNLQTLGRFNRRAILSTSAMAAPILILGLLVVRATSTPLPVNRFFLASPAPSGATGFPLEVSPDPVSLGSLSPGQGADERFTVCNRGRRSITIVGVETSCSCVDVTPARSEVAPGESVVLSVRFNPADEPDFRGRLAVVVTGHDSFGGDAFRMRVSLEVQNRANSAR